ncbi:MAG: hypothetical protein BAJALOKI1v1_530019 [Promethearchaeota archaeon]|nr:MAG: hypothetical protein BAJALOKI1v1_530019 [Candidatus Lokiarchaeota archaeon]
MDDDTVYYVYILETKVKKSGKIKYYTGYTSDLYKRLRQHKENRGAKFCRGKKIKLKYFETHFTRSEAMRRELEIKALTHAEKAKLISTFQNG